MSDLKFFSDELVIKDKRIILRLDFNVPMTKGVVRDNTRLKKIKPNIDKILKSFI